MPQTFNEPPAATMYAGDWNNVLQPLAYDVLRERMPNHTILLTADYWSSMERLTQLNLVDPTVGGVPNPLYNRYDTNTIWDFHPFRPSVFAQQGYIYAKPYCYMGPINYPIRFPPDPRQRAKIEADFIERATAAGEPPELIAHGLQNIGYYFDLPQDEHWIRTEMLKDLLAWAASQGIPPARLGALEYGIVRTNRGFPMVKPPIPGGQGPDQASAVAYLGAMKTGFDWAGVRTGPIHFDTLDYGLTVGQDHHIARFDPLKIAAIAPHRHLMKWSVG